MLVAEKEKLRKEWEECFDEKLDKHLTDKGMEKFYSPETSLGDAVDMLTKAAVIMLLNEVGVELPEGKVSVVVINGDEPCTCKGEEKKEKFKVANVTNNFVFSERFDSPEEAQAFIKDQCMKTHYVLDDFGILQEME